MAARFGAAGIGETGEVMGKTRRNRVVAALGAGGVLATVLSAAGPAALAQPTALPKACVAIEALVTDGISGPGTGGGEVLRVSPGGQSTLTTNSSPPGNPALDTPSDMAFLPNGDIVITDEGSAARRPAVIEVNPGTGARTLISGRGQGSGPALQVPVSVAVEASGDILVADEGATAGTQLLRITPATGDRVVLSANGTGTGPTLTGSSLGLEGGVIYLMDQAGTIMSVDPVTGDRTLISGPTRGTGPGFAFPVSMASDSANSVVVLDMKQAPVGPGFGLGALIRVDLATGNRTVLSVDGTPKGSPVFDTPIDVRYDACENAFYVLQTGFGSPSEPGRVMKVDATTGTRSLFATYQGAENYALLLRPAPVKLPGGGAGQPSNQ
jgi:hypothetical protein